MDANSNNLELPDYFINFIIYALTSELSFYFGIDANKLTLIQAKAQALKLNVKSKDNYKTSIKFKFGR